MLTEYPVSIFYSSFNVPVIVCVREFHGAHASQVLTPLSGVGPPTSATILSV